MYEDTRVFIRRCGNINSRDLMPLISNIHIELFDIWRIDYKGPFLPSKKYEYILVAVDYVSKWVEAMLCRNADSMHQRICSKK